MASNRVVFNPEAKEKILKGIDILYRAVSTTLGPRGRNVGIDYGFQKTVLHDGVSVANVILLKDLVENFGASIVMEAAKKQVKEVGDATTATIILAHSIITESEKLIEAGVPSMSLRQGLEEGIEKIIAEIEKLAKPITTDKQRVEIATISAEDPILGQLVADVIKKVGSEGLITVEESKSPETFFEHQEGMQFDQGYASPYLITNQETMEATLNDTNVLVTDMKINPNDLLPLFKEIFEKRADPLTIIGVEPTDSMRDFLVVNKLQGKIRASYVKSPAGTDRQNSLLQDIAILTGARFISEQKGDKATDIKYEDLGTASRITSFSNSTEIIGGGGVKSQIKARCEAIKTQIDDEESEFEKDKLKERFAKLTGGVGVIKVGGQTEVEMHERKERVDDAVHALRAAITGGIIPGGEVIYITVRNILKKDTYANTILKNALIRPFNKLVENAGYDAGRIFAKLENEPIKVGFDVTDGKIKDMEAAGIIDPANVTIQALRNALSVAVQIITTDVVVIPEPEETKK